MQYKGIRVSLLLDFSVPSERRLRKTERRSREKEMMTILLKR